MSTSSRQVQSGMTPLSASTARPAIAPYTMTMVPGSYPLTMGGSSTSSSTHGGISGSSIYSAITTTNTTIQESERTALAVMRAEAAENRLLRAMARFSSLTSLVNVVTAARHGNAIIAAVESRNELGELASWDDFVTTSPLQYLKAELKTPLAIAELKRNMSQYEIGVPLMEGGSLGLKLLPNLCISRVQRDDLDCQEGDKIVSVDGMSVKSIDELRISLKGKQEVTMIIETGGTPLFTIHDALTPFWEVTSIPLTTTVRGGLKPGDLVLRVNDEPVAGLDTRKALDTAFATIGYLPGESKVAQRIRKEGLMSFATKVEVVVKEGSVAEPKYNIMLTKFEPEMYAGTYEASILLGNHQIGKSFQLEIAEGPADAQNTQVVLAGLWQTVAGEPLHFKIVCYDGANNPKLLGGCKIAVSEAKVTDLQNGTYAVEWTHTKVGKRKIMISINGEIKQGVPECDVIPAEVDPKASHVELVSVNPALSVASKSKGVDYTIVAGTRCAISVKLFDQFGNARPRGKDMVTFIQLSPIFENEAVGSEISFLPIGLGTYEYQGMAIHACSKNSDNVIETSGFVVLVNGQKVREDAIVIDALPSDVNLEKCIATVTPAGIQSRAGEKFEFDVIVRDTWNNLRNRTQDIVELFEYNSVTKQQGDRWGDLEVTPSGHGSYRVTAVHTIARQTYFTYVVNGISSFSANQVYLLTITPHDVNVSQCVITGETTSTVGQYISQLISLRDEFGNVLSPQQTAALEIAVANVKVLQADIDPNDLKLSSRVSRVDHHPGLIYTHQLISTTEQSVHVALDLMIGQVLLQRLNFTFEPDDVDERMCVIENLPRTIVAGEQFAIQIKVRDAFKNGLSGLEQSICLLPKDAAEATAIAKVSGTDLGKGNYVMSSKIYKSFHLFGISIHAGGKIIHSALIEVHPGKAKAKNCDFECHNESRAHFPVIARILLRDEFGNIAFPDENYFSVEIEGCSLQASDVYKFAETGGIFSITFLPKTSGEIVIKVFVGSEQLTTKSIAVRGLSNWTKEDAKDWILTLGYVEARLSPIVATLSENFLRQGVTGAKIAGGLLDRGAFHFAFGIEDMQTAQFLANCLADLSKGPTTVANYLPWSWKTPGNPQQVAVLSAGDEMYNQVVDRFKKTMLNATVTSVERLESANLYHKYASTRCSIGNIRGGNPGERFLWYAPGVSQYSILIENGFSGQKLKSEGPLILGNGYYFAADPRLADFWNANLSKGAADTSAERCLILVRVAGGTVGTRDFIPDVEKATFIKELDKLENQMAPCSHHSATSSERTELVIYRDHAAYPEYFVRYTLSSAPMEVEWPRRGSSLTSLLKLEDVPSAL